jgi:hypothetical protein
MSVWLQNNLWPGRRSGPFEVKALHLPGERDPVDVQQFCRLRHIPVAAFQCGLKVLDLRFPEGGGYPAGTQLSPYAPEKTSSSAPIMRPRAITTTRSITLRNSRTLPGQL